MSVFPKMEEMLIFSQFKEKFTSSQYQALQNQESCYSEYVQNIENYNSQLQAVSMEKERM